MIVLGIETSCDETAVAIIDDKKNILAHELRTQINAHIKFGGVVPEIAARNHIDFLDLLIKEALSNAKLELKDIDAIAVTSGPGLIGGLIVGVMVAKGLAAALNKPIISVNHLEGHALTARLTNDVEFPFLLLLVSGGHCQILKVNHVCDYEQLGSTIDDAVGEAFDKVAKMLDLGYPGGPAVEKAAAKGNASAFELPLPLYYSDDLNFSFSGLKTAVKRIVDKSKLTDQFKNDMCASFQATIARILCKKIDKAVTLFSQSEPQSKTVVVAGGVAANKYLRESLADTLNEKGMNLVAPPLSLCTDNGAMIAWAGIEKLRLGKTAKLDFEPRSRWPLMSLKNE